MVKGVGLRVFGCRVLGLKSLEVGCCPHPATVMNRTLMKGIV